MNIQIEKLRKIFVWICTKVSEFLSRLNRRKVLTFSFFLLLAISFRFFLMSQTSREISFSIPLKYTDVPDSLFFESTFPRTIDVKVEDKEWALFRTFILGSIFRSRPDSLAVDVRKYLSDGLQDISGSRLLNLIKPNLPSGVNIQSYMPQSISLKNRELSSKKVSVIFDGDVTTKENHFLSGDIILIPDSVTVYGSEEDLKKVSVASTIHDSFENLSEDKEKELAIAPEGGVRFSPSKVIVSVPIAEFVRKELSIPVTCSSLPEQIGVKFFPNFVSVSFDVSLKDLSGIGPEDFVVDLAYTDLVQEDDGVIAVRLIKSPTYIRNIAIEPSSVEFILEKQER